MKKTLAALVLAVAPAFANPPAPPDGSRCDRSLPRGRAAIPQFNDGAWVLVDQGRYTFDYKFYARPGEPRDGKTVVTAMSVTGDRGLFSTDKLSWQVGSEIYSVRLGPEGEKEEVCVRAVRGGFDLDRLYQAIKPRLERS